MNKNVCSIMFFFSIFGAFGSSAQTVAKSAPADAIKVAVDFENVLLSGTNWKVYYGAGDSWLVIEGSGIQPLQCVPSTFGKDPKPNVQKSCLVVGAEVIAKACAKDFEQCNSGSGNVVYGVFGKNVSKQVTGPINCAPATFGKDPAPNIPKNCFFYAETPKPPAPKTETPPAASNAKKTVGWLPTHVNADQKLWDVKTQKEYVANVRDFVKSFTIADNSRKLQDSDPIDTIVSSKFGATILCIAAQWGDATVVDWLLRNLADAAFADTVGFTPLHYASPGGSSRANEAGIKKIVDVLVGNGANVNAKDKDGKTPLAYTSDKTTNPVMLAYIAAMKAHGAVR